jgi:hypothetical protein
LVQRTQVEQGLDHIEAGATRLLGLEGLAVLRVEADESGSRVVHVVTAEETASACPSCGVLSASVKGQACSQPRGPRTPGLDAAIRQATVRIRMIVERSTCWAAVASAIVTS